MLFLNNLPTESDGRIARTTPRRSATGEISWDIDVAFEIDNEEAASSVDEFVPGAHTAWVAGQKGGKGVVKSSGGADLMRVEFSDGADDADRLASGHADLVHATVTVNGESATLCTRFRVHGMLPQPACELVYRLDDIVYLRVESHQLSLFDPTSDEPVVKESNDEGYIGSLVVIDSGEEGTGVISGVVIGQDDAGVILQEMNGAELHYSHDFVRSSMWINIPPNMGITDIVDAYKTAADAAGVDPDWGDIIEALGLMYSENTIQPSAENKWPVNVDVLRRAVVVAAERTPLDEV